MTEKASSYTALQRRTALGIAALLFLLAGPYVVYAEPWGGEAKALGSALLRVGIVLGAIWMAWPDLQRVPKWMFVSLLIAALTVAWRPRAIIFVGPALVLLWALRGIGKLVE